MCCYRTGSDSDRSARKVCDPSLPAPGSVTKKEPQGREALSLKDIETALVLNDLGTFGQLRDDPTIFNVDGKS